MEALHTPSPRFTIGEAVRVMSRPLARSGRVPTYLRGCRGVIEHLVAPEAIDGARGDGQPLPAYRVVVPMSDLFPNYTGSPRDDLHLEICEAWLERIG